MKAWLVVGAVLDCVAVFAVATSAAAQPFPSPPVRLTDTTKPERQCNIVGRGDTLVAMWFGGPATVGWNYSLNAGQSWSPTELFGSTCGPGYCEFFSGHQSICVDSSGTYYCAARWTRLGETIVALSGRFGENGLTWERRGQILPEDKTFELEADYMQVHWDDGILYLAYTEVFGNQSRVKFTRSLDAGATWSAPLELAGPSCSGSRFVIGPEGELYVCWVDFAISRVLGRKSVDQGIGFGPPFVVSDIVSNWENPPEWDFSYARELPPPLLPRRGGSGLLSLAVDRSTGPLRGGLYAAWTEGPTGQAEPTTFALAETEPNDLPSQANPMSVGQSMTGVLFGTQLENIDCDWFRFEGEAGTTLSIGGHLCGDYPGGFSLFCDDPPHWTMIGGSVDDCAHETEPLIYTLPSSGRYYLFAPGCRNDATSYRIDLQRFHIDPGSVAQDHRDVVLSWSQDGGATWSPKRRVNDDVGFDNALPSVVVDDFGVLHVTWYDRRDQPECSATVHTYWSHSEDGGHSFAPGRRLSDSAYDMRTLRGDFQQPLQWTVGDYMGLAAVGGRVHAAWSQPRPPAIGDNSTQAGDLFSAVIHPDPNITPVQVTPLRTEASSGSVMLRWSVLDDHGLIGFRLHRAPAGSHGFEPLQRDPLPAIGRGDYVHTDSAVRPGASYQYRLQTLHDGGSTWSDAVQVTLPDGVVALSWREARPNPFTEVLRLRLALDRAASGRVGVFDVAGHEVKRLHDGDIAAGETAFRWDGRDASGRDVPPGLYLVRAKVGTRERTIRISRLR